MVPEELEVLLSDCSAIKECIVLNKKSGDKDMLHAKIVYNTEMSLSEAEAEIKAFIDALNKRLVNYKRIKSYELQENEMEKTTTLKIKR